MIARRQSQAVLAGGSDIKLKEILQSVNRKITHLAPLGLVLLKVCIQTFLMKVVFPVWTTVFFTPEQATTMLMSLTL